MIRRCIWRLSSGQALGRRRRAGLGQPPFFLSSRHEFSSSSPKKANQKPAPEDGTSRSTNNASKLILGSVVVGAAVIAAYQTGYVKLHVKDDNSFLRTSNLDTFKETTDSKLPADKEILHSADKEIFLSSEITSQVKPNAENVETSETNNGGDFKINTGIPETISIKEESAPYREEEISISVENATAAPVEKALSSEESSKELLNKDRSITIINSNQEESRTTEGSMEQMEDLVDRSLHHLKDADAKVSDFYEDTSTEVQKVPQDTERTEGKSLAETYSLLIEDGSSNGYRKAEGTDAITTFFQDKEAFTASSDDNKKSDDVKLVLDFIEAIHVAERRQAESDAYTFTEEKRKMKEKFEKELKDARARELMYAEEAAILEKELNKEKAKAAATIKSIQEQSEQKLREELQRKEEEADVLLKKAQDLAKAELAAAIASEKSSQMEKIAEANLHINALCMAFYARSEEARQTHSVHKLALGTLALEDALSKGLPIRAEVDALYKALEGIDRESLLGLVLSSLPDDTVDHGIDTPLQLSLKFDSLKGTLRHFSLIPSGGGGLLAHVVARIASSIKMREDGSSDSIESLISKVENFLAEKKFAEAADALVQGVRGTEAEVVAIEWSSLARNRAVAEQALSLLQSYALSITFG
ncbi:hypothetical protein M5K25_023037 [Dendrobium thyrsiflorum]|uniref:MICOS complex subunit MIC60 n=1 Tax=Dendrobium thyrsiflorum TaxID=117978 RepID=A0ABD0UE39_DENTH